LFNCKSTQLYHHIFGDYKLIFCQFIFEHNLFCLELKSINYKTMLIMSLVYLALFHTILLHTADTAHASSVRYSVAEPKPQGAASLCGFGSDGSSSNKGITHGQELKNDAKNITVYNSFSSYFQQYNLYRIIRKR
jgi:hypothetical protein